jgi:type I restriction enzyme S subunit
MRDNVYVMESKDTLTKAGFTKLPKKQVPLGAICVSCLGTVGLVSMAGRACLTNQQINSLNPRETRHRLFLFCLMRSLFNELESLASGSTVTPKVNHSAFCKILGPWPDTAGIERFNAKVSPYFTKILALARERLVLARVKELVLPKLLSRELNVGSGGAGRPSLAEEPLEAAEQPEA